MAQTPEFITDAKDKVVKFYKDVFHVSPGAGIACTCISCSFIIVAMILILIGMALLGALEGENTAWDNGALGTELEQCTPNSTTADCIDKFLKKRKSPLAGHGKTFVSAGEKYRVSAGLLIGIAGVESTFGTKWDAVPRSTNNYMNITCRCGSANCVHSNNSNPRCWRVYSSFDSAIIDEARLIRKEYLDKGLTTVSQICVKYVDHYNAEWIKNVTAVKAEIDKCFECTGRGPIQIVGKGQCAMPTPGHTYVTSRYGPRRGGFHRGIDFSAPTGATIVATMDGTVTKAQDFGYKDGSGCWGCTNQNGGFGNRIQIRHTNGVYSEYHHVRSGSMKVRVGQSVAKGQPIGQVDDNGWSSGEHLHFGLLRNSEISSSFNPASCLGLSR